MHTVLVFASEGNFYRQLELATCSCCDVGRAQSVRVLLQRDVGGEGPLCVEVPGHGTLRLQCGSEVSGDDGVVVALMPAVTCVHAIEVWRSAPADAFRTARAISLANMCGRLPAQDLWGRIGQMPAVQTIRKCFGRKFCVYTLAGNISFDSGFVFPQFRGVGNCARFVSLLRTLDIEHEGMTLQLAVFCGDLGRTVTISEQGTLWRLFPRVSGCTQRHGVDCDATTLRFSRKSDTFPGCKLCVAVTRHGCVTVRACFRTPLEFASDSMDRLLKEAEDIMNAVRLVC